VRTSGAFPEVKVIYSDSEVLDQPTREFVESTFNAPVLDFYASVECGMIAFQVPGHDEYHVNEDFVLLEKQQSTGLEKNEGEVVITNLYNSTTPIIRYEIGDVVDFGEGKATENSGIPFRTIKQIHGKYLDFIVLPDETVVSPHVPKQDLTHLEGIHAFQLVQDNIDHVQVKIQKSESFTPATEQEIRTRLDKDFKGLVKVEIEYLEHLCRADRRKFKVIESKVAQDFLTRY
jgi:phenylacetate-CoA ligase